MDLLFSGGKTGEGEARGGGRLSFRDSFGGLSFPSVWSPDEVAGAGGASDGFSGDEGLEPNICP